LSVRILYLLYDMMRRVVVAGKNKRAMKIRIFYSFKKRMKLKE
jgi:hypothetical protein